MENVKEKNCRNCKHFHQHYINRASSFRPIDCGHCPYRKKHITFDIVPCDKWQQKDVEEEKEILNTLLTSHIEKIQNILNVLLIMKSQK